MSFVLKKFVTLGGSVLPVITAIVLVAWIVVLLVPVPLDQSAIDNGAVFWIRALSVVAIVGVVAPFVVIVKDGIFPMGRWLLIGKVRST